MKILSVLVCLCSSAFFCNTLLFAQVPQQSGNLMTEIVNIRNNMPGSGSEGFVKPSFATLSKWSEVFNTLLDENYPAADSLVDADFPFYQLIEFTDNGFQNRVYYLLKEQIPTQRGWGTFIINPNFRREIAVEIPHPRFDVNTHREGTDVFRETEAHFLLMSGTHRCANNEESLCSGTSSACEGSGQPYKISDMAHYEKAVFQLFHEIVTSRFPGLYSINLHGNSRSNCEDFFLSSGVGSIATSILLDIKSDLLTSGGVTAAVTGDGTSTCPLVGSTNVQGRYTNGSSDPCTQVAASPNGFFIHIEQSRNVRDNPDVYGKLIDALNAQIQPVTAITPITQTPETFLLFKAYPNPFNPSTTLEFSLPKATFVTLKIFDGIGREMAIIVQNRQLPGKHAYQFDAAHLPGGVYFASLQTDEFHRVVKLFIPR